MTNKEFEQLPKNKQRVVIAQDVLAQIAANFIKPERQVFLALKRPLHVNLTGSVKKLAKTKQIVGCESCANGALLMALILKNNRFTMQDYLSYQGFVCKLDEKDTKGLKLLLEIFSREQLALLESAFESGVNCLDITFTGATKGKLTKFLKKHGKKGPESLMIEIMKNVIKNDGNFLGVGE